MVRYLFNRLFQSLLKCFVLGVEYTDFPQFIFIHFSGTLICFSFSCLALFWEWEGSSNQEKWFFMFWEPIVVEFPEVF